MPPQDRAHEYYVTAPLLWPLLLGVSALGVPLSPLLERAGLTLERVQNPDSRFSAEQGLLLTRAALELSGDCDLGLKLAQLYEPGAFSVLDYLAHSSSTLRDAIERLCRYEGIHQNGVQTALEVDEGAGVARLAQRTLVPFEVPRQVSENSLANMLVIARKLTGQPLVPREVWFSHARPAHTALHEQLFQCRLRFDAPYDALVFDTRWLSLPLPKANPALAETLERHAREQLAALAGGTGFLDVVRKHVAVLLPDGNASIERVAKAMQQSARTLQRRLREEGVSYQQVLDELRVGLALRYLNEPSLGIEDVALMLGFSDSRAFRRAFHRWRGESPSDYRKQLAARR